MSEPSTPHQGRMILPPTTPSRTEQPHTLSELHQTVGVMDDILEEFRDRLQQYADANASQQQLSGLCRPFYLAIRRLIDIDLIMQQVVLGEAFNHIEGTQAVIFLKQDPDDEEEEAVEYAVPLDTVEFRSGIQNIKFTDGPDDEEEEEDSESEGDDDVESEEEEEVESDPEYDPQARSTADVTDSSDEDDAVDTQQGDDAGNAQQGDDAGNTLQGDDAGNAQQGTDAGNAQQGADAGNTRPDTGASTGGGQGRPTPADRAVLALAPPPRAIAYSPTYSADMVYSSMRSAATELIATPLHKAKGGGEFFLEPHRVAKFLRTVIEKPYQCGAQQISHILEQYHAGYAGTGGQGDATWEALAKSSKAPQVAGKVFDTTRILLGAQSREQFPDMAAVDILIKYNDLARYEQEVIAGIRDGTMAVYAAQMMCRQELGAGWVWLYTGRHETIEINGVVRDHTWAVTKLFEMEVSVSSRPFQAQRAKNLIMFGTDNQDKKLSKHYSNALNRARLVSIMTRAFGIGVLAILPLGSKGAARGSGKEAGLLTAIDALGVGTWTLPTVVEILLRRCPILRHLSQLALAACTAVITSERSPAIQQLAERDQYAIAPFVVATTGGSIEDISDLDWQADMAQIERVLADARLTDTPAEVAADDEYEGGDPMETDPLEMDTADASMVDA